MKQSELTAMKLPAAARNEPRFLYPDAADVDTDVGRRINKDFLGEEEAIVRRLATEARLGSGDRASVRATGVRLVEAVRRERTAKSGLDAFLRKYDLSSQEGVILMCLAEALLRIPDDDTADRLIADKIRAGDWESHLGDSESLFVNASTWGLLLTGRMVSLEEAERGAPARFVGRLVTRMGEPMVRGAMRQAMRIMGHQFVMGRTIDEALERSLKGDNALYRYSFDMLGESALTAPDAERYFDAYRDAIVTVGRGVPAGTPPEAAASISVKLSALHPRYERANRGRVLAELGPRLVALGREARSAGVALTVDAEESERLELSLELVESVCRAPELEGWHGFGLAVQAYQKRASAVIDWLAALATAVRRRLNVRLVKGAYWDSEIKRAQERGLDSYPVFTRKCNTDVSYLAMAGRLLRAGEWISPQFATHNAHTVAYVVQRSREFNRPFEFQRLHGMGEELYAQVVGSEGLGVPCRVYAPVGEHEDLLPYLVRRLLENGANTSFVNRILDERLPPEVIAADPVEEVDALPAVAHPRIPVPQRLFGQERVNSRGLNLADGTTVAALERAMTESAARAHAARPIVNGRERDGETAPMVNPARRSEVVGSVTVAHAALVDEAMTAAAAAAGDWAATPAADRARALEAAATLFETRMPALIDLAVREAGKSVPDGIAEVREAVDFLRYYAVRARAEFGAPLKLPGPTGESNELMLTGRGVFVCISPWNFPLAIFTGQVAAALAAGNAVVAKPAEQTPLIAAAAVRMLHESGIPGEVLQFLPGDGLAVGARAVADPRVAGVAFTGSTDTARAINRTLAERDGPIPVLIAETGGQNAMIVDSSALPEQVVLDALQSGFNSAGQRCSALRILCLQEEIAPKVLRLLAGAMDELQVGDPAWLRTDVGPVIDVEALRTLETHAEKISRGAAWFHRCRLAPSAREGHFLAPLAVEIDSIGRLEREVFGPIIHVLRYRSDRLEGLIDEINATGYGLTFGIHTRIDSTARRVAARVQAGNVYVNRNMIGAVVGVQPFGGCGLSGTGPKAGGPHYLHRFAHERTLTINTSAVGGNASLLAME
jgi:RHH-type transcriptional regulator, proline utilization regulon repressor / proline dehydrogenase / delta 1-pyrroline-5-carboxylate dehydrogenase